MAENVFKDELLKYTGSFAEAVQSIAKKKLSNRKGAPIGTQKIDGYVSYIHDDPNDPLYGTVDVQEFGYDPVIDYPEGFHEGVQISAVPGDDNGMYIVPMLLSDVVINTEPISPFREFIVAYSRAKIMHLHSHDRVTIGVDETAKMAKPEEELSDIRMLKNTGNSSNTLYEKDKIVHTVVRNGQVSCFISLDADGTVKVSGKNIKIDGDTVKHNSGEQKMVLGDKLIGHLQDLCQAIATMAISTPQGAGFVANQAPFTKIASQLANDLSQKSYLE